MNTTQLELLCVGPPDLRQLTSAMNIN